MSDAIAFDTHRYVKNLMAGGFDERQAETLAEAQIAFLNTNLSTKTDIEEFRQGTKAELEKFRQETRIGLERFRQETRIGLERFRQETRAGLEKFRQETKADIAAAKNELIKWMVGVMFAMTGVFATIVKFT